MGGLLRFGWNLPQGRANLTELHGPLMVFGFLGTVISLERAVAVCRPWGTARTRIASASKYGLDAHPTT